ncbi:MAG TPA: glycosyltransferase family 39 protein, partial [Thermoanaerobaculia bacterium]
MKRSDTLLALAAVVLLAVNAYGALVGFPVMDDGELLTTAREAGPAALIPTNRDRPVNAWLIHTSYGLFGERRRLWVGTAAVFWAVFAWQTARLVRRVLPDGRALAGLCVLLVLAPLVVEMQHTTLTFVYAAMLPTILAFEALLLSMRPERDRDLGPARLALVAALVAAGALVSEYSIAVMVPAVVFLAVLARVRAAAAMAVGAGIGLLGFRAIADLNARPDTMPGVQAARLAGRLLQLPTRWLSGVWYTLAGAYGSAAGAMRLDL